ncbi:monocarboxylate transporter 14-like [Lineus longissimus]|uniref:monocarboxylate transporter 14-like n=1 Tax=Lineus longissimus TaxID=88925 RepID=UPI00315CE3FA
MTNQEYNQTNERKVSISTEVKTTTIPERKAKKSPEDKRKGGDGKQYARRPSFFEGPRDGTVSKGSADGEAPQSIEDCYSWIVMVAALLSHLLMFGICWTVGVYYVIFLEVFQQGKGPTSWIGSINSACLCFIGPLAGVLMKKFDNRVLMIIGCLLSVAGLIASAMATNIYQLYATFGVVAGCGIGLSFLPCMSVLGGYFDRHRTMALGLAATGTGFGTVVYPPLIRYLDEEYGWRGSLLIMAGITLNLLVTSLIMKPKPQKTIDDADKEKKSLYETLGCSFFKNYRFVLICFSSLMQAFGFGIVYMHLAVYAKYEGVSDDNSAILYSCIGLANFVGRLFWGFSALNPRVNVLVIYILSVMLVGIPIEAVPLVHTYSGLIVISVLFGFFSASVGPLTPDILIQFLGVERFAHGLGYLISFEGIGQLVGAPVAGWLCDATGTYSYSFYLGGTAIILSKVILLPALKRLPLTYETDEESGWMNSNLLYTNNDERTKSSGNSVTQNSLLTVRRALFDSKANLHRVHAFGSQYDFGTQPNMLFGSNIITGDVMET